MLASTWRHDRVLSLTTLINVPPDNVIITRPCQHWAVTSTDTQVFHLGTPNMEATDGTPTYSWSSIVLSPVDHLSCISIDVPSTRRVGEVIHITISETILIEVLSPQRFCPRTSLHHASARSEFISESRLHRETVARVVPKFSAEHKRTILTVGLLVPYFYHNKGPKGEGENAFALRIPGSIPQIQQPPVTPTLSILTPSLPPGPRPSNLTPNPRGPPPLPCRRVPDAPQAQMDEGIGPWRREVRSDQEEVKGIEAPTLYAKRLGNLIWVSVGLVANATATIMILEDTCTRGCR
ncbi:lipoic acid synthase 1 [Actinidia rufa]|uniref:Lipoic acid synthase 1 n=1 Tax=Actinidia rufa TaxID=165716 RepID=A0A7J0FKS1_9ERIC|nr:lipoic acid synthase 1 [Actinidia rufa]